MLVGEYLLPEADALLERAPCGLVVTTEDGTILRSNQTFSRWLGSEPTALLGRRFQSLLTMGGRIFHQTHWAPLMKIQGSVAEVKLDLQHADGHVITMLLNGVRHEHAEGVFYELAMFGTVERDRYERELLSARKRAEQLLAERSTAEQALQEAKAELALAYRDAQRRATLAEQMVAVASHDLKNPLTAIKMATGLLARGDWQPRQQQLIGTIGLSCERAQRMIADLLDLASARMGQGISIQRQVVALPALVDDSVNELRVAFPHARIRHLSKGRGQVALDPDRLYQTLGNLVANAAAYGDLRHAITLTSDVCQGAVSLSVHNHGPAIEQALIERLFEPMTRASERSAGGRSVGLGLFIVREIVTAHGGEIRVHSSQAQGTTFMVRLPAAPSTLHDQRAVP
ncbi:PAS domain-containing sensor histidine kinase [Pseudomonas sp. RP23018S]|uniref:PAS domain-containing sensor histidine kinase n=1 Tax=Pseudomonas sp. RP23018S TaxID=3096037 RepID=UPI002ACA3234|nr:PAS domain-containing sensor histidine kinase [Pseudomonas sp. RP23018S]MDZ5605365.1 PAS domain-containing sensor histidine kinase [Pseudomonas sp. RP23018S]